MFFASAGPKKEWRVKEIISVKYTSTQKVETKTDIRK